MAGRGGNDIASAVTWMLEKVIGDKPTVKTFILWFDSCVPQNRNSYMSAAMREFILKHPQIDIIEQKFCEPGHSCIQEVDNIHSQIDRAFSPAEIFSPLGVVRTLPNVNRRNPFTVVKIQPNNVKAFNEVAALMNYKTIPYFSVKILVYRRDNLNYVFYKMGFREVFKQAKVMKHHQTRHSVQTKKNSVMIPDAKIVKNADQTISVAKKKDIESMYPYMPQIDVAFYKTILK